MAVVKATKEVGLLTDHEGSDTWRYRESGAASVALLQQDLLTLYISHPPRDREEFLSFIGDLYSDYDLVLFEGFKSWNNLPKIWLLSEGEDPVEVRERYAPVELVIRPEEGERALKFIQLLLNMLEDYHDF